MRVATLVATQVKMAEVEHAPMQVTTLIAAQVGMAAVLTEWAVRHHLSWSQ